MDINKLVKIIDNGRLAIVPTDTVYGIIADATNENAIKKVYEAKRRDYKKPLIIMISSLHMLDEYIDEIHPLERKLIEKYWPNKLTILFKKSDKLSSLINNGGEFVGIRFPDSDDLIKLINQLNRPIVSTSANLADQNTITSVDMIDNDLMDYIDYIYDDGYKEDIPSTIVKINDGKIEFLRRGELSAAIERDFIE